MTNSLRHIILFLLLIAQPIIIIGQSKVIVVTRKIEQKWEAKPDSRLYIKGEKAKITIEQSNSGFIEVELKLKSKHSSIEIAKKELKYLKYNLNRSGHDYYLNNQILLPSNNSQPEARLEAEYFLKVPNECFVQIENKLGDIRISDLDCKLNIYQNYGNIVLENINGELSANMKIGDITINNVNLEATIYSIYSEINMKNISGDFNLQTKYGSLNIESGTGLNRLKLDVNKTDVNFLNKECKEYNLDIETQFGEINALQACYIKDEILVKKVIQKGKVTELNYNRLEALPEITIKSKFATIKLE